MQSFPVDLPFASEHLTVWCLDFRPLIGTPRAPQKDTEKLDTWKFWENHQTTISEYLGNNFGIVRHLFWSCHKAKDDPKFGWRFHLVQRPCLVNRFWSSFFSSMGICAHQLPKDWRWLKTVEDLPCQEFGEVMQCESPKNSFHMEGGDWTFVWNPSPGILWGDLLTSWEKGPRNERCGLVSCQKMLHLGWLGWLLLYTSGK
jgi:hypothetical protein